MHEVYNSSSAKVPEIAWQVVILGLSSPRKSDALWLLLLSLKPLITSMDVVGWLEDANFICNQKR